MGPIMSIVFLILLLCLLWYMFYLKVNTQYDNHTQLWANLYNIRHFFSLGGFTLVILFIILFAIKKEGMSNSSISSTDPMVISQTTAGAIKTIHDQLPPPITQDMITQLSDAANNQSDQISVLQTNSTSASM